jgi:hypothetical protein
MRPEKTATDKDVLSSLDGVRETHLSSPSWLGWKRFGYCRVRATVLYWICMVIRSTGLTDGRRQTG